MFFKIHVYIVKIRSIDISIHDKVLKKHNNNKKC